jgi:hypothetical protein
MITFINDGNYFYRYLDYEIILMKKRTNVIIDIVNRREIKKYRIKITDDQLTTDDYFQSIKTEHSVLSLFGLTDIELLMILIDNCIKKNAYTILWVKLTPTNIRDDTIKFNVNISPTVELSFNLPFEGYI